MSGRESLQGDPQIRRFAIDYQFPDPEPRDAAPPRASVSSSAGEIREITVQYNPINRGWRLAFQLDSQGADTVELRAQLEPEGRFAETWLYRWTA
jgi:glucan biosynthesis protein